MTLLYGDKRDISIPQHLRALAAYESQEDLLAILSSCDVDLAMRFVPPQSSPSHTSSRLSRFHCLANSLWTVPLACIASSPAAAICAQQSTSFCTLIAKGDKR